jgi:hypothetical protein
MVRAQISLTEDQMRRLRTEAQRRGVPIAAVVRDAVVRDAVDRVVPGGTNSRHASFERALAAAGSFDSGTGGVAARHDELAGDIDW